MADTRVEALPEECLSHVISFTSPCDACRSAVVSATFCDAADSDLTWENFLPSDYREIISRSVSPVEFSSKKDLFRRLSSTPLLIDGDKCTNKKCFMLSARELSIAWSSNSLYWSWKPLLHSRFFKIVELIKVCWLEIHGKINIELLSPNTTYGAYLIIQLMNRAFGLDIMPSEVSIEVGGYKTQRTIYLKCDDHKKQGLKVLRDEEDRIICERKDRWLEIELGEFYNSGSDQDEVKMWFREIKGVHLKGVFLLKGLNLDPNNDK